MKKLFAVLLTLTLVLSMGTIALAADTGTITINNAVDGETYNIYRIFDLESYDVDAGNYSYKLSEKWAAFTAPDYFEINELGYVEWVADDADNADDVNAFVEAAYAYAKDNNIASDGETTAADGKATFSDLPLGYYLVDTSLGALCSITTTDPSAEVNEKNQKPDIEKKIVEDGNLVDANNVAIGDTVDYQTKVTVGKGLTDYVVHDKMSAGLTPYDSDDADDIIDVVVTVGGVAVDAANYTVVTTGLTDGCTFEIKFEDSYIESLDAGDEIVITYSATLNENAVVGATGNPNTVTLSYTNETEVETKEDNVITYTTKLTVDKVEIVDGEEIALEGAGFTLYKDEVKEGNEVGEEITNATTFVWNGLEEGKYILVETKVPEGYNKAKDIEFTITCDELNGRTEVTSVSDKADWTVTVDANKVIESTDENDNLLDVFEATVVNKTGSLLPETGGIGTTIFYVVGSILMLAALVLLVSKKRMANFA